MAYPAHPLAKHPAVTLALLTIVVLCAVLTYAAWTPGMMSYDSLSAWRMSETGALTNAHPALYIVLIQGLRAVADTPASMLAFNIAIFSLGSLFLGLTLKRYSVVVALLVPFVILLPFVTNFIGVLWKDTSMAASWWAASAIGLYVCDAGKSLARSPRVMLIAVAVLLFVAGIALRHNAVFAGPFLLSALILAFRPAVLSRAKAVGLLAATGVMSLAAILLTNAAIDQFYNVKKIDMVTDLYLYDLAGISKQSGRNQFAVPLSQAEFEKAMECYRLTDWNSYAHPDLCLFVMNKHSDEGWYRDGALAEYWMQSVLDHPVEYLSHRLNVFASLLRIGERKSYAPRYAGIDPNEFGLHHPEHDLYQAFQIYIDKVKNAFFMKPWFWLAANIVAIIVLVRRRRPPAWFAAAVATSGLAYLMTYLPFGIASDFRYAYWTIFATVFAWCVIASLYAAENRARRLAANHTDPA